MCDCPSIPCANYAMNCRTTISLVLFSAYLKLCGLSSWASLFLSVSPFLCSLSCTVACIVLLTVIQQLL
ncbi:uncharacterized protein V1518DRAFT_422458 [Limtongia smithiae]|uniref:uncharacterized protein n=1 Tax=Limtongia smithiae TaxID=1125753 RepID=UPI0034CF252B